MLDYSKNANRHPIIPRHDARSPKFEHFMVDWCRNECTGELHHLASVDSELEHNQTPVHWVELLHLSWVGDHQVFPGFLISSFQVQISLPSSVVVVNFLFY